MARFLLFNGARIDEKRKMRIQIIEQSSLHFSLNKIMVLKSPDPIICRLQQQQQQQRLPLLPLPGIIFYYPIASAAPPGILSCDRVVHVRVRLRVGDELRY